MSRLGLGPVCVWDGRKSLCMFLTRGRVVLCCVVDGGVFV